MSDSAFLVLRTVIYHVDDLDAAKDWYTRILGLEPYFDEPFYVGYNVGGYELGHRSLPRNAADRLPTGASRTPVPR